MSRSGFSAPLSFFFPHLFSRKDVQLKLKKFALAMGLSLAVSAAPAFASAGFQFPKTGIAESASLNGKTVSWQTYAKIPYVKRPSCGSCQRLTVYVPEAYLKGGTVNGYTKETAPIFLPNSVGGYMPGDIADPKKPNFDGGESALLAALARGYVVVSPAIRGRTTKNAAGRYVGKAPALIVDYKAAVRYLRAVKNELPAGNTDRIISDGTSAGGALSVLLGSTGNDPRYLPYLKKIGAAKARDDIFAAIVFCPITLLSHADEAYEWVFKDETVYHQGKIPGGMMQPPKAVGNGAAPAARPDNAPTEAAAGLPLSGKQIAASKVLARAFPATLNRFGLKDADGKSLTLKADGTGSFADYIRSLYIASAEGALKSGADISRFKCLTVKDGHVTAIDMKAYAKEVNRLKPVPAFDWFDAGSGENDEFGTVKNTPRHFTAFSSARDPKHHAMAPAKGIALLDPFTSISRKDVTVAPHFRIRHGFEDRDTVLAVPASVALKLAEKGSDVDFAVKWGKGHAGDYDLDSMFDWADGVVKKAAK